MKKQVDVWEWDELIALLPDAALEDVAKAKDSEELLTAFRKALLTELRPKPRRLIGAEEAVDLAAAFSIGFISGGMLHLAWAVGEALSSGVPL